MYYASLTEDTWETVMEEDAEWNYAILGHGISEHGVSENTEQLDTEVIDSEQSPC